MQLLRAIDIPERDCIYIRKLYSDIAIIASCYPYKCVGWIFRKFDWRVRCAGCFCFSIYIYFFYLCSGDRGSSRERSSFCGFAAGIWRERFSRELCKNYSRASGLLLLFFFLFENVEIFRRNSLVHSKYSGKLWNGFFFLCKLKSLWNINWQWFTMYV